MTAIQTALFDYAELDTETRIVVQQRTTEIKALMNRAASDIIDIGQKLIEVKAQLGHGSFGGWLAAEFDWQERTAQNFMLVANQFKSANFADLKIAPSALYLLAAPSTPESVRIEAIDRAAQGETITYSTARGIVSNHKNPPIPFVPDEDPLTPYEAQVAEQYAARYAQPAVVEYAPVSLPVVDPPSPPIVEYTPAPVSHQLINQSTSNEWYTPPPFLKAAHEVMGGIDLDPASNELANKAVRATRYYTIDDDGFNQEWGTRESPVRVWLNPPYGRDGGESNQSRWSKRLIKAYHAGTVSEAILLVNAVPGNEWFKPLKDFTICFPDGRIRFYNADVEAGDPTHSNALIYFGSNVARFVKVFSQFGAVMARLVECDGRVRVHGLEDSNDSDV